LAFTAITQTVFKDDGGAHLVVPSSAPPSSSAALTPSASTTRTNQAFVACSPVHVLLDALETEVWMEPSSATGDVTGSPSPIALPAAALLSDSLSSVTLGGLARVGHLAPGLTSGALLGLFTENVVLAGISSSEQVVRHQVCSQMYCTVSRVFHKSLGVSVWSARRHWPCWLH
jgi:hypothetical protein